MKSKRIKKRPRPLEKVKELFHTTLAQPRADRIPFLDQYKGAGPATKEEVRELLAAHEENLKLSEIPGIALGNHTLETNQPIDLSLSPTLIGPYLLLQRIDSGGMAEVYLARKKGARGFEKEVALKCVLPKHGGNSRVHQWFEEEAKLGAQLNHPNIVQIHDFVELNDGYWLVMEYILGKNLSRALQRLKENGKKLNSALSAYIACELFKALAYAHQRVDERTGKPAAVTHRDISPKNIILSFQGALKVVDYGIAKVAKDSGAGETQAGLVVGTPGYMSPEQSRGEKLQPESDVYSAALIFYELLASKPLWEGTAGKGRQSFSEYSRKSVAQYQTKVAAAVEALPVIESLKEILVSALAWNPSDRPTAEACRLAIENAYRAEPQFGQQALRTELSELFAIEIAEENAMALARERKIEIWRARGLFSADLSSKSSPIDLDSWKRSPIIMGLLTLTILTTAFNVFLQVVPDSSILTQWLFNRQLASIGICSLHIDSNPAGARVTANYIFVGNTPVKVQTQCGQKIQLQLERDGYRLRRLETKASEIERHLYFDLAQ